MLGTGSAASRVDYKLTWQVDCRAQAGLQALFSMSRQISPVCFSRAHVMFLQTALLLGGKLHWLVGRPGSPP